jgi:hypothetical protein
LMFMPPRKPKRWLKTHTRVNEWWAKYIGFFAARAVRHPIQHEKRLVPSTGIINPLGTVGTRWQQPGVPAAQEGASRLHLSNDRTSTSWQCDTTLHRQHKVDKELFSLVLLYPTISASKLPSQGQRDMGRLAHPSHDTRGASKIRLASN